MSIHGQRALVIHTPEGVAFTLRIAGPVRRALAWMIDAAAIAASSQVLSSLLQTLRPLSADLALALDTVLLFTVSQAGRILLEWYWRGQTIGKFLLRLRVMDAQGLRLRFDQIVMRNLLRAVDVLPAAYGAGGAAALFNRRGQRLGDLAANTIVVHTLRLAPPEAGAVLTGKFNSFRAYPHLEARLRQRTDPEAALIALEALRRRDVLLDDARVQLFQEIAENFRAQVRFPEEATSGLTDEQYVRNAVDALYRPQLTV